MSPRDLDIIGEAVRELLAAIRHRRPELTFRDIAEACGEHVHENTLYRVWGGAGCRPATYHALGGGIERLFGDAQAIPALEDLSLRLKRAMGPEVWADPDKRGAWIATNQKPKEKKMDFKPVMTNGGPVPRIQHVRVFQEPDGWHWCDEQLDYLDARGASYDEPWQAALASIGRYTEHVVLYGSGDTPETLEVVRRERPELTWYSEVDWSERGISTEEEERLMAAAKRAWEREHLS